MEKGAVSVLFIVVVMLVLVCVALGDPRAQLVESRCSDQRQINTTYSTMNYIAAMDNIRSDLQTEGYGVETSGRGPDAVYILAQCYGDLSLTDCVLCYTQARSYTSGCFSFNGGLVFLDGCFMRISNYSFFEEYTAPKDRTICGNRTQMDSAFQDTARQAVLQAASSAPNNNGYARAEMSVSGRSDESAYVLANCWRTLNSSSCIACLENASTSILECLPSSEGRALNTGCFMRYSDTDFLNPRPSSGSSSRTRMVIIVVVCSTVVVAGAAVIGAYIYKHKRIEKRRKGFYKMNKLVKMLRDSSLNFKYSILEKATDNFHEGNKLGQGGFGAVYKGVLPDGREIAVKRLFFNAIHKASEFFNEVNIISSVEHKNLVRLLGCSVSGPESLLVYEFLPNSGLDRFIFGSNGEKTLLNWEIRFAIIIGIAEGLVYLHENPKGRIIHRDIKASNILLDTRFRAKIADFGLARSFQDNESHISTALAGTLGYMAPEYLSHGQLTEKADVYSFGVLLLEIVTGMPNNGSKTSEEYSNSLVTIVWEHFQQGKAEELIDPNLVLRHYNEASAKSEVLRVIHVGLLCVQEIPSLRPSMSEALQMLAKKDEHLPPPSKPPFIDEQNMEFNYTFDKSSYPVVSSSSGSAATTSRSMSYPR